MSERDDGNGAQDNAWAQLARRLATNDKIIAVLKRENANLRKENSALLAGNEEWEREHDDVKLARDVAIQRAGDLEVVKAERDDYRELYDIVCENLVSAMDQVAEGDRREAALEIERDALAAHVERLNIRAVMFFKALDAGLLQRELEDLRSEIAKTPATSLARLKARWKAEAIRETANDLGHELTPAQVRMLRDRADRLSRQAEEGSRLRQHCKQTAEEVSSWPEWKRNCLATPHKNGGGAPSC